MLCTTEEMVSRRIMTAVKWYKLAAQQGNVKAHYNLGVSYDPGEGVPQDYKLL